MAMFVSPLPSGVYRPNAANATSEANNFPQFALNIGRKDG
jgi:hypothetical protein